MLMSLIKTGDMTHVIMFKKDSHAWTNKFAAAQEITTKERERKK